MTVRTDQAWRNAVEETVRDAIESRITSVEYEIVESILEIDRHQFKDSDGEQRQRIYAATLELLARYQQLVATEAYRPSMVAVAHEFQITPADLLFLQNAIASERRAA